MRSFASTFFQLHHRRISFEFSDFQRSAKIAIILSRRELNFITRAIKWLNTAVNCTQKSVGSEQFQSNSLLIRCSSVIKPKPFVTKNWRLQAVVLSILFFAIILLLSVLRSFSYFDQYSWKYSCAILNRCDTIDTPKFRSVWRILRKKHDCFTLNFGFFCFASISRYIEVTRTLIVYENEIYRIHFRQQKQDVNTISFAVRQRANEYLIYDPDIKLRDYFAFDTFIVFNIC